MTKMFPRSMDADSPERYAEMPEKQSNSTEVSVISPTRTSIMDGGEPLDGCDQIGSLFTSVRNQTVEFQCQFAKATSDWALSLNLLTGRVATLEPLLNDALKVAKERQRTVDHLTASNKELRLKLSEAERELLHFRPLAMQLEEDLRLAKDQLEEAARNTRTLESENARATGEFNDLYQKLATAEAVNERIAEENLAYSHKLGENDVAIQTLMRETAQLKSDLMSATSDLERAERDAGEFANRLAVENEELKRTQAALDSTKLQIVTLKKESSAQVEEAEERERRASEALMAKDKQIYDLEVKLAGVNSKNDFLNRMLQRMRDDLRRHLDHIGTLESSNRQLLDALSRNSVATADVDNDAEESQRAQSAAPKLRAVPD